MLQQTSDSGCLNRSTASNTQQAEPKVQKSISSSWCGGETGKRPVHASRPISSNFAFTSKLLDTSSSCFLPRSVTFYFIVKSKAHIAHFTVSDLSVISDTFLDTFSFLGFCDTPLSYSIFSLSLPSTFSAHPSNAGIP